MLIVPVACKQAPRYHDAGTLTTTSCVACAANRTRTAAQAMQQHAGRVHTSVAECMLSLHRAAQCQKPGKHKVFRPHTTHLTGHMSCCVQLFSCLQQRPGSLLSIFSPTASHTCMESLLNRRSWWEGYTPAEYQRSMQYNAGVGKVFYCEQ